MPMYQVSVNVRAVYDVDAKDSKEAKKIALEAASSNQTPDNIEYAGDGIDNCVECS